MYLSKVGEPSPDGGSSPFFVVSRRILMINPVNIKRLFTKYVIIYNSKLIIRIRKGERVS
jgi:hypothetical protein